MPSPALAPESREGKERRGEAADEEQQGPGQGRQAQRWCKERQSQARSHGVTELDTQTLTTEFRKVPREGSCWGAVGDQGRVRHWGRELENTENVKKERQAGH